MSFGLVCCYGVVLFCFILFFFFRTKVAITVGAALWAMNALFLHINLSTSASLVYGFGKYCPGEEGY